MNPERSYLGYAAAPVTTGSHQVLATEVFGSYTLPEHSPGGFALDVGASLSIWTITAQVNAGVNAHVYRASDPDALHGRDVALKVLLPQSAHGRQDQVVHEVAAMSSLTLGHPHLMSSTIARRINTGPYTGGVLIVMPWASLNLREYVLAIRRGDELPDGGRWARTTSMCEALAGIADGLAHLHELQTSHGDVKPDNIMLVDGVWKLGDFGLTRPMEGSYVLSAPGTLSYTAPEEARAQHADPAAEIKRRPAGDVWALGVTLHFAVTGGRFPMPGITPDERLAAVRQGVIQLSPEVQLPELRHLLAEQLLVDDLHRGTLSYERRTSAAQAGEVLRRIAATEHLPTRRIRVEPAVDSDAMLRYRGQCERVAAQTVEQWRDLGPWDATRAATTQRSRGVLRTMLTNRLSGLEPPPELRLRKSVLARTLGLRAPYETCRVAARENAIVRYAPPIEDSTRVAWRLLSLSVFLILLTALATAGTPPAGRTVFAAALMAGVVALFAAVAVGGRFPEPAYVFGSRSGPLVGAVSGALLLVLAMALLTRILAGPAAADGGAASNVRDLHDAMAVFPSAAAVALLGWYGAGVFATRHAITSQRRAANPPPRHLPRPTGVGTPAVEQRAAPPAWHSPRTTEPLRVQQAPVGVPASATKPASRRWTLRPRTRAD
ncbi:MAG: protein kinase [Geodermatophilaceae bacterium]|nr:protein kinase [Geodermatophilaceae bacterium]